MPRSTQSFHDICLMEKVLQNILSSFISGRMVAGQSPVGGDVPGYTGRTGASAGTPCV